MNIEILEAADIDYREGLDRFSGNAKLYEKYLYRFLDITLYQELKQAIKQQDLSEAFECSHKLKAFVGNLSMPKLYDKIFNLTEDLRRQEKADYDKKIEELDREYEKICRAIIRSRGNG